MAAYDGGAGYNTFAIISNDGSLAAFEYLGNAYFINLDKLVLQDGSNQGVQITGNVSHTGTLVVDAGARRWLLGHHRRYRRHRPRCDHQHRLLV